MKLFKNIRTFLFIPFFEKRLLLEAAVISGYVKVCFLFLPFSKVRKMLIPIRKEDENFIKQDENAIDIIKKLTTALYRCKKITLWKTECYNLSLTAKLMLRRRQISSKLYIGLRKNADNNYEGHAWVIASDIIVVGKENTNQFTVHSIF